MSKIHGMMDIGKRSMMNSQTALQTVGHNIANRGTEGFSRQRVETQSSEPVGLGKLRIGTGSKTAIVQRINNPYLEKQIGKERAVQGYLQGKADAMTRVEQVYNEQVNKGLNTFVAEFFNAFREFGNNPESLASRTHLRESADSLTKDFKRIDNQLKEIEKDIDQQVVNHIGEVNEIAREVAHLNEKIQVVQMSGGPANDERDRRDALIKQLGEKINIRWAEGEDGMVTITAGNSALLVTGYDAKTLEVRSTPGRDDKSEGSVDVFYMNNEKAEPMIVTGQLTAGAIGGLLEIRDKAIQGLLGELDQMAYALADSVNQVHSRGYDAYNRTGGNVFEVQSTGVRGTAANLSISEAIKKDAGRLAAAAQPGSPADNRIANAVANLQFETVLSDGTVTLDEYYNSMVGKVGGQARRLESAQSAQKDIVRQLGNIRDSISGVSLDEETTKLIEYQKAFDASARLIRTADEMFDTVLNLKRM
jgi:flagellar hook-associated protein 1